MTSSFYPLTTDNYFDHNSTKTMPSNSRYSSSYRDDSDDDLDALRKAALQTLNSRKRKNRRDDSSSSSSSSHTSRSSYTRSSINRSNSRSSISSISSTSLDRNDKDYRFEMKTKDIDERFPNDNTDMLILDCPKFDDNDIQIQNQCLKSSNNYNERKLSKIEKTKELKSPSIERPVSITVRLNTSEFDLRQLIKKRRTEESTISSSQRMVQIGSNDNHKIVHKPIHHHFSSKQIEKH